jgi:High potential iron-sulfur protein
LAQAAGSLFTPGPRKRYYVVLPAPQGGEYLILVTDHHHKSLPGVPSMKSSRRIFMMQAIGVAAGVAGASKAMAQATLPKLEESDAQAKALSYVQDASKVDKAKFPKHVATDNCSNCQLYAGKPADAGGACPLFAGKQVAAKGWCSAWVKKAA